MSMRTQSLLPQDAMNEDSSKFAVVIGVVTATIPTLVLFMSVTYLFIVPLALGVLSILLGLATWRTASPLRRHVGWIALVLFVIAACVPFDLLAYFNRSGYPIVMVIPNGYRGPIKLVIDRANGTDVPLKDGVYTYHIPANGTLVIKDDTPFRRWHTVKAIYASGERIPPTGADGRNKDTVFFHSLGSGSRTENGLTEEYLKDFVGTEAELQKYLSRN